MKNAWKYAVGFLALIVMVLKYYISKSSSLGAKLKMKDFKELPNFNPSVDFKENKDRLADSLTKDKKTLGSRTESEVIDFWKKN